MYPCAATAGSGLLRPRPRRPAAVLPLGGQAPSLPARAWPAAVLGLLALLIASVTQPRMDVAWATDEPVFTPIAW